MSRRSSPPPSRRQLLAGLGAGLGLAATACDGERPAPVGPEPTGPQPDPPEPTTSPSGPHPGSSAPDPGLTDWLPPGAFDPAAFPYGVQSGDAVPDGVVLSVRTAEPALKLHVVADLGGSWSRPLVLDGLAPVDVAAKQHLSGLQPDTEHRYTWLTADGQRRSAVGRFRTAPEPGSHRILRLGATSCLGNANPGYPALAAVAAEPLDAFVLLGDAIYTRATTLDGYRAEYDALLAKPAFQALSASTSLVAIWDDHEVANDWILGPPDATTGVIVSEAQLADARRAFDEALPHAVPPDAPLWRTLRYGDDLEIIVLDCRRERDLTRGEIVSEAQLAWAIEALRTSTATFQLVVTSVHVTDHGDWLGLDDPEERWQWYPEQRERLLEAASEAPGAVFLAGDMHYGALQHVDPPGGSAAELYEISAGPAGSVPEPISAELIAQGADLAQYPIRIETWNVARIEVIPAGADGNDAPELRVSFLDDAGAVLAQQILTR